MIKEHTIIRKYIGIIRGIMLPTLGTINANISRSTRDRVKMVVNRSDGGREATTHYRTLESYGTSLSKVECKLETGRTHQIRVHMAYKRKYIMGDRTYNPTPDVFPRQALHSYYLGIHHPITGEFMEFKSPFGGKTSLDIKEALDSYMN